MEKIIDERMLDELREAMGKTMTKARYTHTVEVEKMVVRLCELYCPEKKNILRAAALLHDFTKEYDVKVQLSILTKPGIEFSEEDRLAPKLFHARTASLLIPDLYNDYANDEVISAVRWHTTGRADMTITEKVLYLADYIDMSREYEDCKKLRKYFFDAEPEKMDENQRALHLEKTLLMSYNMTMADLLNKGAIICKDSVNARNDVICAIHRAKG